MLISDIADIVQMYQDMTQLDILIETARNGRISVSINGKGMGNDMAEAVQGDVVAHLRQQRSVIVKQLATFGFQE